MIMIMMTMTVIGMLICMYDNDYDDDVEEEEVKESLER